MNEIDTVKNELTEVKPVLTIHEFMALLNIKSQTTFNKRAADSDFPEAIEWPPRSRTRGWRREEVEAYLNEKLANATRWGELPEQPLAGAALGPQSAQQV